MGNSNLELSTARSFWPMALLQAVVFLAWILTFLAAALLEYAPHASLWFPPAAITFASVLVLGIRAMPSLFLACLIVTMLPDGLHQTGLGWTELLLTGIAFGLTHVLIYGTIALLLRRGALEASPITTLRKVSWFLLVAAVAAGLSSVFGALSLAVTGMMPLGQVPALIAPWWIGDYAGLVTVAPFFGLVLNRLAESCGVATPQGMRRLLGREPWRGLFRRASRKLGLLLLVSLAVLLTAAMVPDQEAILFLLFVALIIQLWIAHTESELATLAGILAFSVLMAMGAAWMGLADQALMMQFIVISLAVTSYLGLAVPALYRDNHSMRQKLTHDSLTGAMTRSFFEDAASSGIRDALKRAEPACLVMVDLNGLKPINDRHGHAAGDLALKLVAEACARNLASGQLLGRLSGDEFAMFLSGCRRDEAERVVAAIHEELAAAPPVAELEHVGASFGIAELVPGQSGADYKRLLRMADQAMYREKMR